MIFREEDFSQEEFRSVALLVERRAGDCGRNEDGTFGMNNDCQEDAEGISGNVSPFAKSRTPTAKKESKKGGGGGDQPKEPLKWNTGKDIPDAFDSVQSKPPVSRSPDGAVRSEVFDRSAISSFAGKEYVSPVACGRHLAAMTAESRGRPIDSKKELSDDEFEFMAASMTQQAEAAMSRGHTPAFYSPEERKKQIDEYAKLHPVMFGGVTASGFKIGSGEPGDSIDPSAEFLFRAVQALTSPQASPFPNMQRADQSLTNFFTNPDPEQAKLHKTSIGGNTSTVTKKSLERLQAIIDKVGLEETARIFSEPPIRAGDLEKFFKERVGIEGFSAGGYSVDEVVPIFSIFGPKVGPFFANNTGDYDSLTADVWFTRTWGRLTGELVTETKPDLAKSHAKDLKTLLKYSAESDFDGLDRSALESDIENMAKTGDIPESVATWALQRSKRYSKEGFNKGVKGVRDKANARLSIAIIKNLASTLDEPETTTRRSSMIKVMREVSSRVGQPVAYVQDLLWQDEQDVWGAAGARTATDIGEPSLFSTGIERLVRDPESRPAVSEKKKPSKKPKKSKRSADGEPTEDFEGIGDLQQMLFEDELQDVTAEEFAAAFADFFAEKKKSDARSFFKSLTDRVHSARSGGESSVVLRAGEARHLLPRIGFDSPIPAELRASLPESLSHARTLIDLHVTKEGANWWRDNGTDVEVFLDLADRESPQNRAFDAFVRKFFHESRDLPVGSGNGWASSADLIKFDELWDELDSEGVWDEYDSEGLESRSADCGRDEDGKFGEGNSCQIGINVNDKHQDFTGQILAGAKTTETRVTNSLKPYIGKTVGIVRTGKGKATLVGTMKVGEPKFYKTAEEFDADFDKHQVAKDSPHYIGPDGKYGYPLTEVKRVRPVTLDSKGIVARVVSRSLDEETIEYTFGESRSADCGRDEGGKFGPKNDCASGDGYRGGHKAPRSDGYSKSADDVTGAYPDDVYSKDGGRLYGHGDPSIDNESAKIIQSLKGKPDETVRIYRAVPSNVDDMINPGDWVSINETYAKQHGESTLGGDYKIVSMTVPARHIFTDGNSIHEWGYDPKPKKKETRASECGQDDKGQFAKGNDCASGGGSSPASLSPSRGWGRDTEKWGDSSETEIWTPDRPLFSGSEKLASIKIERPNEVRDLLGDSLKMSISDAVMASGAIVETPQRAAITQPRLGVRVDPASQKLTMWWTTRGIATGKGFRPDEKEFADKPGTSVTATEASRTISLKRDGVVMHMDGFFIHPDFQGNGLALESVSRSISSPVARLEMTAERYDTPHPNRRLTGYKVWPKYGYDAPISKVLKSAGVALPKEFSKAKTILDLFAMPGGPEWWSEFGNSIDVTFDNRPRSRSREVLLQYQDKSRRKNQRSVDVSSPTNEQLGTDSDYDDVLDEVWTEIQKKGLSGQSPSEDDWERWEKERTDGSSGEVRSH